MKSFIDFNYERMKYLEQITSVKGFNQVQDLTNLLQFTNIPLLSREWIKDREIEGLKSQLEEEKRKTLLGYMKSIELEEMVKKLESKLDYMDRLGIDFTIVDTSVKQIKESPIMSD